MLTQKASRERMWVPFPALRKALEDKHIPASYYGPTSVSDDMLNTLHRLVEIAVLAHENESAIKEVAQSVGVEQMYRDLFQLRGDLEAASSFFKQHAEDIKKLFSEL